MPFVLPDGSRVSADAAFHHNDIHHSRGWLRRASQAELDALGITWEDPPAPPAPPPPAPPTREDVTRARDAVLALGHTVVIPGYPHILEVQTRPQDWSILTGLYLRDINRMPGDNEPVMFRCANNITHFIPAGLTVQLYFRAVAHRQAVYQAAWALKDMDPIPADYATNPAYWPASG